MKANTNWKLLLPMLLILVGIAACKKTNNDTPTPPPVEVKSITITELRALSTGASVKVPDGRKVKGIVISDASAKNIDAKTVVLQEATDKPGIVVTFDAAQNFATGDEVEVIISNQTLAQVNGEITLQNIPAANAKKTGTGTITPRTTTIVDINTNKAAWNGTLVTIADGLFNGSGKYTGTLTYASGNASIKSQVITGASFENADYPTIVSGLTGIIRIFGNDLFLNIRNTSDVGISSGSFIMVEDFSGADKAVYSTLTTGGSPVFFQTSLTQKYPIPFQSVGQIINYNPVGDNAFSLIKNLASGSNDADADFLTAGRNYYTVLPYANSNIIAGLTDPTNTLLYGKEHVRFASSIALFRNDGSSGRKDWYQYLKSITIVFAGSKMKISDFTSTLPYVNITEENKDFEAAKDGFWASLTNGQSDKIFTSPVYTNVGQWQTVTFKDVNTKLADFDKINFSDIIYLTFVSKVNQRGRFAQIAGSNTYNFGTGTPIIIDKIIFEFSQKPDWAN